MVQANQVVNETGHVTCFLILNGPVARICRFHRHGRGSIPRWGIFFSFLGSHVTCQLFVKEELLYCFVKTRIQSSREISISQILLEKKTNVYVSYSKVRIDCKSHMGINKSK
ncbi:hypothetical protein BD560DRAFT_428018 [Blakeslea trispora]|nr:hypothetical protein BD560DRAFT_428018 [Blakeslea trispora]